MTASDIWIFGYGSLIWRVDFPVAEQTPAYIKGWQRRFWQGSTDHRGVPGSPGRVVTLHRELDHHCWGMAYRLPQERQSEVMSHLDHREKGGYERLELPVYLADGRSLTGITYHATPDNPNYLGDASIEEIARQVAHSIGPSGPNTEYLLRLEAALLAMNAVDDHVFALAEQVRRLCQREADKR